MNNLITGLVCSPFGTNCRAALDDGYRNTLVFIKTAAVSKKTKGQENRHVQTPVMDVCLQTCSLLQLGLRECHVSDELLGLYLDEMAARERSSKSAPG